MLTIITLMYTLLGAFPPVQYLSLSIVFEPYGLLIYC